MQTFLPDPNLYRSARCLDDKRLNKQIVEAYQILTGRVPCANHPACLMWEGYHEALKVYIAIFGEEYTYRTGKNHKCVEEVIKSGSQDSPILPSWRNDLVFNMSHKINLLRKDYPHYSIRFHFYPRIFQEDLSTFPDGYYWPVEPVGKKAKQDTQNWESWWAEYSERTYFQTMLDPTSDFRWKGSK